MPQTLISPLSRSIMEAITSLYPELKLTLTFNILRGSHSPPLISTTGEQQRLWGFVCLNKIISTGGSPPYNPDDSTVNNTNEPYLDWVNFILAQESIPQTFTTSYGDDEQSVPKDYADSVCNSFAQLGARGSSVMFSSGDGGVGLGDCKTNDGKNTTQFLPIFPSSCKFLHRPVCW